MHSVQRVQLQRLYQFFNCVQPFIIFYTRLWCANRIYNPKRNVLVRKDPKTVFKKENKAFLKKTERILAECKCYKQPAPTNTWRKVQQTQTSLEMKKKSHKNNQMYNLLQFLTHTMHCAALVGLLVLLLCWWCMRFGQYRFCVLYEFVWIYCLFFSHLLVWLTRACEPFHCVKIDCWSWLIRQLF